MYKVALLGMLLATTQGCVLGTNPTARHVAMAVDGAFVVGGIAVTTTANRSSPELGNQVFDSTTNSLQTDVGAVMLVAGLVGLVINAALQQKPTMAVPASPGAAPSALAGY
jgi:hypothetical protein